MCKLNGEIILDIDENCSELDWENFKDNFLTELANFEKRMRKKAIQECDYKWLLLGRNLGWRKASGEAEADDPETVLEKLCYGLTCRLKVIITSSTVEVHRYHHDAPTGEFIDIKILPLCNDCQDWALTADGGFSTYFRESLCSQCIIDRHIPLRLPFTLSPEQINTLFRSLDLEGFEGISPEQKMHCIMLHYYERPCQAHSMAKSEAHPNWGEVNKNLSKIITKVAETDEK